MKRVFLLFLVIFADLLGGCGSKNLPNTENVQQTINRMFAKISKGGNVRVKSVALSPDKNKNEYIADLRYENFTDGRWIPTPFSGDGHALIRYGDTDFWYISETSAPLARVYAANTETLVAGKPNGRLSKSQASQAIVIDWEMMRGPWVCLCSPSCTGSGGDVTALIGIQDLPQQNSAKALLEFKNAPIKHSCPGERIYSGPGEAIFDHLTDGRWMLRRITTSEGPNSFVWDNLNILVE